MTDRTEEIRARLEGYLVGGGLFNPELANHDAVRSLIVDCRDLIGTKDAEIAQLNDTLDWVLGKRRPTLDDALVTAGLSADTKRETTRRSAVDWEALAREAVKMAAPFAEIVRTEIRDDENDRTKAPVRIGFIREAADFIDRARKAGVE